MPSWPRPKLELASKLGMVLEAGKCHHAKHGKLGSPLAMEVDSRGKSSKTVLFLIKLEGNILVGGLEH